MNSSELIAKILVDKKITTIFSVVGGGSMYLNNAFGHNKKLKVIYNHHEQASAIAAEAYARLNNKIAVVCVTSGPGGTNAMTGCLCGYMGSIPMLIISGQVRKKYTTNLSKLKLRTIGEQEIDITKIVSGITKYSKILTKKDQVAKEVNKAIHIATTGRPGPVWLDVPLDIQSANIENVKQKIFKKRAKKFKIRKGILEKILLKIGKSKKPVLFPGAGIRLSNAKKKLETLARLCKIPVVTAMSSTDLITNKNRLFAGRAGITGDYSGNLAVQNSDLILSIGNRLSLKHTGYNLKIWAPKSFKIMVDIDSNELKKMNSNIDMLINCDAEIFLDSLIKKFKKKNKNIKKIKNIRQSWINQCKLWIQKYPVVALKNKKKKLVNIYYMYKILSNVLQEKDVLVTTSGMSRVVARQAFEIKKNQRIITNHATSPMGYCLPAAIGACFANNKKKVFLVTGDGGIQLNIQELQTIKHHNLPIKIIVINNDGYHSIRNTQDTYFRHKPKIGIGSDSKDISFPNFQLISKAYKLKYVNCKDNDKLFKTLSKIYQSKSPIICEIFVSKNQKIEPKVASSKSINGKFIAGSFEKNISTSN